MLNCPSLKKRGFLYEGDKIVTAQHFIPKGWKRVSLHQVAYIQTGLAKGKKDLVVPVEVPYLRVANVQDGHLDLSEIKMVQVSRKELERYLLKDGDVLMTEGGDFDKLGRGFVWEGQIENCLHQNHVFAVRTDKSKLNPYFLSYQAGSGYGKGYFLNCAKQSTNLASINSSQLKEYPVLLPGLKEQEKIVEIIRGWDRAIDLAERLIAAKQERRTWLTQQLLTGKRRLPGFRKTWFTVHLGDVFTNRVENGRNDLPLIAITGENGVVSREGVGRKDTSSVDKSRYLRICPGDIGYNTMRMWQGVCGLSQLEGIVSPAYTIVTPKAVVDGEFMALLFKSPAVIHLFHRHSQGLVDDTLNLKWKHFAQIKVTVPVKAEQEAIASAFRAFDRELVILRIQLDTLREQKKGLMQRLLAGKVRVKM
jgi:type I restriction enzyme S subunit